MKGVTETFEHYPDTGALLPAMGYGDKQLRELEQTINQADADAVLIGTPINLANLLDLNKPAYRIRYELQEIGQPTLATLLEERFGQK